MSRTPPARNRPLPRKRARNHQARNVDTREQHHESDGAPQDQDSQANAGNELLVEWYNFN